MESTIVSPVTDAPDIEIIEEYNQDEIKSLYAQQFGIDIGRFFCHNHLLLVKCKSTGFRFFYPKAVEGDGEFYSDLARVKKSYYHQRWEHGYALTKVHRGSRWLEIGVGDGFFLEQMSKKSACVSGLELNQTQVDKLRKEGLDVYSEIIEEHLEKQTGVYDGIALFQVLEHIYEVKSFFLNANRLLKERGRLIISVPNNNPYLYMFDKWHVLNLPPHHVGYWDKSSLIKTGNLFGFAMLEFKYDLLQRSEVEYIFRLPKNNWMSRILYFLLYRVIYSLPLLLRNRALDLLRYHVLPGRNICMEFEKIKDNGSIPK